MGIPPGISEILLPQDDLNVVDLVDFAIPIGKHTPDLLALDNNTLFSKIESLITCKKHISFLHSLSIPTAAYIVILLERLENATENPDDQEKPKSIVYPLPTTSCPNI